MRITQAHIENLTDWVNAEKGYPRTKWEMVDGRLVGQINHICAYRSSGSWHVVQMVNHGGGEKDLRHGTAREVFEFLRGMQEAILLDQRVARYEVTS